MPTQALYDLTPLASMLLAGGLLALLPLIWVAWRQRHGTRVGRLQAVSLITLFLTFDLVLFGAFTRLSDSGLGCPDWPGCYGHASPIGADKHIEAAESAMPSGPGVIAEETIAETADMGGIPGLRWAAGARCAAVSQ